MGPVGDFLDRRHRVLHGTLCHVSFELINENLRYEISSVSLKSTFQIPQVFLGLGCCCVPNKKRSGDFRSAVGNLKFYKSCLCRERPWISTFSQLDVQFPFPRFPGVVWQALVWRCSWNAYGTKTGLRKFVVPFPLKGGVFDSEETRNVGIMFNAISRCFFKLPIVKKTPRTGSTLAACPENSEVCLWTSVPLAKKFFSESDRCSMGLVYLPTFTPKTTQNVGK